MHGALGKTGRVGERAQTQGKRLPFVSHSLTIKIQINEVSSRLLIVTNHVAHQDVEHVVVDGDGFFEARHIGRMKEEGGRMKAKSKSLYR